MRLLLPHCLSSLIAGLLILGVAATDIEAQTYRYNGNMPQAKMALDMMEVLGYIRRVPDSQYGSGMPSWPTSGLWPSMTGPGGMPMSAGMMAMQNPLGGGLSAFPGMGVANLMPQNSRIIPGASSSLWSTAPAPPPAEGTIQVRPSDLAALLNAVQQPPQPVTPDEIPASVSKKSETRPPGQAQGTATRRTSPQRGLSGVWLGSNQDVLVVTGHRFIWTDREGRSIEGEMAMKGDRLLTKLASDGSVMAYRFRFDGERFVAVTESGHRYFFKRSK